jgi:hypothetical protein
VKRVLNLSDFGLHLFDGEVVSFQISDFVFYNLFAGRFYVS